MTHRKRQEAKSRKRKELGRQKISLRRVKVRADAKKCREEEKNSEDKIRPIRRSTTQGLLDKETLDSVPNSITDYVPSFKEIRDKMILERLQYNSEVLKKLEAEYEAEQAQKEASKTEQKEEENLDSQS